jgi:hypothetical protein
MDPRTDNDVSLRDELMMERIKTAGGLDRKDIYHFSEKKRGFLQPG